jgi:hypothetical protein
LFRIIDTAPSYLAPLQYIIAFNLSTVGQPMYF